MSRANTPTLPLPGLESTAGTAVPGRAAPPGPVQTQQPGQEENAFATLLLASRTLSAVGAEF